MIKASASAAKHMLDTLLRAVRRGQEVLIAQRRRPFAPIDLVEPSCEDGQIASLIERGIILPPKNKLDVEGLLNEEWPKLPPEETLADAVIAEREEGL